MALERIRKTDKMKAALDAYASEFPVPSDQYDIFSDPYMPSPDEAALATEFARELHEVGEKITALNDRYRAIKEWQYRFYTRYPHASVPVYKPEPKEEPKPKITKPPKAAFNVMGGTVYMDEAPIGTAVLTSKELIGKNYSIEKDPPVEVTTFGSTKPEYLYSGGAKLKLDGKPVGVVTGMMEKPLTGTEITVQITDQAFYDHITKGYQFKAAGPKMSNLTVDDVKKSIKKTLSEDQFKTYMYGDPLNQPISQKGDYDKLKAMLDAKIKSNMLIPKNQIMSISTPSGGKKWEFKDLPPFKKDGLFKKKSGK